MPIADATAAARSSQWLASLLAAAVVCVAVPAVAEAGLTASRIAMPAVIRYGAEQRALKPGTEIRASNILKSGHGGRIELRDGGNTIRLGEEAEMYVHEQHDGQLKAVLIHGAAHLISAGMRPLDLRFNVGRLRLKLSGADVWVEQASDGETVCLLAGSVEVQSDLAPPRSLNKPNQCLFVDRLGDALLIKADRQGTLARKLAKTGLGSEEPASGAPAPVVSSVSRAASPQAAAAPAKPASAAAGEGWTIVLASHSTQERAERQAAKFNAQGILAEVRAQRSDRGRVYRVVSGVMPDEAEARAQLQRIRSRYPDAWLTRY